MLQLSSVRYLDTLVQCCRAFTNSQSQNFYILITLSSVSGMQRKLLPIETVPAWAELNNVEFDGVKVSSLPAGKGSGVVATAAHSEDGAILMRVPQELVLSLGNVWMYAKSDQHLREVLEATGEYARVL